jgi:hypothetical protein
MYGCPAHNKANHHHQSTTPAHTDVCLTDEPADHDKRPRRPLHHITIGLWLDGYCRLAVFALSWHEAIFELDAHLARTLTERAVDTGAGRGEIDGLLALSVGGQGIGFWMGQLIWKFRLKL